MASEPSVTSRTTVQVLTAQVPAAIATLAVRGPQAFNLVAERVQTTKGRSLSLLPGTVKFALWKFAAPELSPEHVVVLLRDAMNIEISCHGGVAVTHAIVQELTSAGCALISSLELESSHDPCSASGIEQAARSALARASTLKVAGILLDQLQGALSHELQRLIHATDNQWHDEAGAIKTQLLSRGRFGLKLLNPWRLTFTGPPNAGKSSLLNALCGSSRVLVHDQPGTTRDAVDTAIVIADWPIVVTDTAGIRQATEEVERLGVQTSKRRWQQADIGLLVVDATVGWTRLHAELLSQRAADDCLIVINKSDCLTADELAKLNAQISLQSNHKTVGSSAVIPGGVDELIQAIGQLLDSQSPPEGAAVPFTEAQLEFVESFGVRKA